MNGCLGNRGSKGGVATPKESLRQELRHRDILPPCTRFVTIGVGHPQSPRRDGIHHLLIATYEG
jgi:hypothetical protein